MVFSPTFALDPPKILLSCGFMPSVGSEPPCCSNVPLCSSLSSSISFHHLWFSWRSFRASSHHEAAGCLRSQFYHQTVQCFGSEEQTLRCAVLLFLPVVSLIWHWSMAWKMLWPNKANRKKVLYFWGYQGIQTCFLNNWGMSQCPSPSSSVSFACPCNHFMLWSPLLLLDRL